MNLFLTKLTGTIHEAPSSCYFHCSMHWSCYCQYFITLSYTCTNIRSSLGWIVELRYHEDHCYCASRYPVGRSGKQCVEWTTSSIVQLQRYFLGRAWATDVRCPLDVRDCAHLARYRRRSTFPILDRCTSCSSLSVVNTD